MPGPSIGGRTGWLLTKCRALAMGLLGATAQLAGLEPPGTSQVRGRSRQKFNAGQRRDPNRRNQTNWCCCPALEKEVSN